MVEDGMEIVIARQFSHWFPSPLFSFWHPHLVESNWLWDEAYRILFGIYCLTSLDPNADRLHTPLCLLPSERKCTHPRNNMLFDRAYKSFYPAEPGVGGGGEDLLFEKCPPIRLLCQKCFLWCSESPWLCQWGPRQRDVLALAYLFHTLFHSLVFLFSCCLCLSKPSVPLFARGLWVCMCGGGVWTGMGEWKCAGGSQPSQQRAGGVCILCSLLMKSGIGSYLPQPDIRALHKQPVHRDYIKPGPNYSSRPN